MVLRVSWVGLGGFMIIEGVIVGFGYEVGGVCVGISGYFLL